MKEYICTIIMSQKDRLNTSESPKNSGFEQFFLAITTV